MTENIILEPGARIDTDSLRDILGRTGISGYVEWGLEFDPNWSAGVLNVSPGKAFLLDAHRDYPLLADATIDVSFSQGTVSDVYAIYNADAEPDARADVVAVAGSDGPPTNPSLLLGTVDDTDQSFVESNRETPVASPLVDGDNDGYLELPNYQGIENDYDALVNKPNIQPPRGAGHGLDLAGNDLAVDENELDIDIPDIPTAGHGMDFRNNQYSVDESELDISGGVVLSAADFGGGSGGEQIQNAIDALPGSGGTVYVPTNGPNGGNWNCGPVGGIHINKSNVRLVSSGAKLFLPPNTGRTPIIHTNDYDLHALTGDAGTRKTNIVVEGFELNGNGGSDDGAEQPCIAFLNVYNGAIRDCMAYGLGYGVNVKRSQGVTVRDCMVTGARDDGITISDTHAGYDGTGTVDTGIVVDGCYVTGATDNGIEIDDGCQYTAISNCYVEDCDTGFDAHAHHTGPADGSEGPVVSSGPVKHLSFSNCWAVNNATDGFRVARMAPGTGADYKFTNVTAVDNGSCCLQMSDVNQGGYRGKTLIRLYLDNFYFRHGDDSSNNAINLTQDEGDVRSIGITNGIIYTSSTTQHVDGIQLLDTNTENVLISNVEIGGFPQNGISVTQPYLARNIKINNCLFRDIGEMGIRMASNANNTGVTIVGNTFERCGTDVTGYGAACIRFLRDTGADPDWDGTIVVGNTMNNTEYGIVADTTDMDYSIIACNAAAGCDNGMAGDFGANSQVGLNIFP